MMTQSYLLFEMYLKNQLIPENMNKEFLKKLTEIVEANLANENFGTEDLAREMGMSHSNLNRKLNLISNQTISQFIREFRLKKAKELLMNEDLTAAEIAYRVGFGSSTYFSKCFHEYFGHAPGELRNHEQENDPKEKTVEVEPTPNKPNRKKILELQIYRKQREREGFKNERGLNLVQTVDYVIIKEKQKAFRFIIYNRRNTIPKWRFFIFQCDPLFESIRSDPGFKKVLRYELQ
jgi:AraC-like DNA-binding protein